MKKLMILLALAALLLAGCGAQPESQTTTDAPQTTTDAQLPEGAGEAAVPEEGDIIIDLSE